MVTLLDYQEKDAFCPSDLGKFSKNGKLRMSRTKLDYICIVKNAYTYKNRC